MAKHGIRANRRKAEPKATIQAEPTFYERTHPKGSAERFLDDATKEALVAAAAGGVPTLRQFVPGAVRAAAKEAEKYPDPLLAEAARLPRDELLRRAAKAEAYQKAMEAQNATVDAVAAATSPVGNMVANQAGSVAHDALTRQDAKGGDAGHSGAAPAHAPNTHPHRAGGTRIVINPQVFKDKRDALCVAMNEGFRILMEANGFDPVSEPTEEQRRFFADTEYARDENMLRRTILARILTFDTSVTDPTESQLQEGQEFLQSILEAGLVKTQWEQWAVRRISSLISKVAPPPSSRPTTPAAGPVNADVGGGNTEEEKKAAAPAPEPASNPTAPTDAPTPTEATKSDTPEPEKPAEEPAKPTETPADKPAPAGQEPPKKGQNPAPAGQEPPKEGQQDPTQNPTSDDGKLHGGIDRSQFGQNGHIGIAARIVDPVTGKSRSSLSMNGPAIQPKRAIGDMGSRTLTDTKRMNGPAIQPVRHIGEAIKAPEAQEEELMRKRKKDLFG